MVIVVGIVCFILGELCGVFIVGLGNASKNRDSFETKEQERTGENEKSKI